MIYIFEDRPERRLQQQSMMDKHKGIIRFAKFDIDEGMNLANYIHNNFPNAEIIIIHKSYAFKGNSVNIDAIKKNMPGVRFVVFSGGIENGTISNDGNALTINADIMYNNIEIFLKYLTDKNEINFEPMVWGERYQQNRLVSLQNKLFREYFTNADLDKRIEDGDTQMDIYDLLDVIITYCEDHRIDIQDELVTEVESKGEGITWRDLLQIIQKQIALQEK